MMGCVEISHSVSSNVSRIADSKNVYYFSNFPQVFPQKGFLTMSGPAYVVKEFCHYIQKTSHNFNLGWKSIGFSK